MNYEPETVREERQFVREALRKFNARERRRDLTAAQIKAALWWVAVVGVGALAVFGTLWGQR